MSEGQVEEVEQDYLAYRRALRPLLVPPTVELLDVSVHDGQVQSYVFEAGAFVWSILVGDLQRGYLLVRVAYSEADVVGGIDELDALKLLEPGTELLYDELELLADGRLMHRLLVWPKGEVWVRFTSAQVIRTAADGVARR